MKKAFSILLTAALISTFALSASATFDRAYTAPMGTPTVDGEAEELWDYAEWTDVDKPFDGTADTDSTLRVKLLWDEDNLYFLAEVYDTDLNATEDIVEIYLDEGGEFASGYDANDSQNRFMVSDGKTPANPGTQAKAASDVNAVVTDLGGDNYLMEGSIAWSEADTAEGSVIGLEFMYNDGTADNAFVEAYRWNVDTANGDAAPYQSTEAFGELTLGAAPVIEVPEETTDTADDTATAPATFDLGLTAVAAAILSAAGVVVFKKK
ncbi:MAG TPA: hypothetical protein H9681_09045 [Firmicutes bacterium]|nr:hypothetical protein [Bacillota bacterium]